MFLIDKSGFLKRTLSSTDGQHNTPQPIEVNATECIFSPCTLYKIEKRSFCVPPLNDVPIDEARSWFSDCQVLDFGVRDTIAKGATIRHLGRAGVSQVRWKTLFFHLGIGCISTMPCSHLFISPIFPTKIFIYKKIHPSIPMVPPPP